MDTTEGSTPISGASYPLPLAFAVSTGSAFHVLPQHLHLDNDGTESIATSMTPTVSLMNVAAQAQWPDAAVEFDDPPLYFPLRKSVSDGQVSIPVPGQRPRSKSRPTVGSRILQRKESSSQEDELGDLPNMKRRLSSVRKARLDAKPYRTASAPASPVNSAPSSVTTTPRTSRATSPADSASKQRRASLSGGMPDLARLVAASNRAFGLTDLPTAIAYDPLMLKHKCTCDSADAHIDQPAKLQNVYSWLKQSGLVGKCSHLIARNATPEELKLVHDRMYVDTLIALDARANGSALTEQQQAFFCALPCGGRGLIGTSFPFGEFSPLAARMAAGCAIETCVKILQGDYKNGLALVRPPGHLVGKIGPAGECLFNNVAVAARVLLKHKANRRILIVSWSSFHSPALQDEFIGDSSVLVVSMHHHSPAHAPAAASGFINEVGSGVGVGYNINIGFPADGCGDSDYISAVNSIILPIAHAFQPDIVLVTAGFDSQDVAGGLTPAGYAHMTKLLGHAANGRVALILDQNVNSSFVSTCAAACLGVLVDNTLPDLAEPDAAPHTSTVQVLRAVVEQHKSSWPVLTDHAHTLEFSPSQHAQNSKALFDATLSATSALASLSMIPRA